MFPSVDKFKKLIPNQLIEDLMGIGFTEDVAMDVIHDVGVEAHCSLLETINRMTAPDKT